MNLRFAVPYAAPCLATVMGSFFSLCCLAQTLELPAVKAGDTWKYRSTVEKGSNGWTQTEDEILVSRVTSSSIYYSTKQSGSTQPPKDLIAGLDWRRTRDINGTETVVNQPLEFPLSTGNSWTVEYTEQHPNKAHTFEQWQRTYKAVGYETVEVPAGRFHALKIEAEGRWTAEREPAHAIVQSAEASGGNASMVTEVKNTDKAPVSGRTYKAFWYAPEVKRWVKSVEEYYGSGGVRTERYTTELESFTAGP